MDSIGYAYLFTLPLAESNIFSDKSTFSCNEKRNNSAWMAQDTSDGLITTTSPERFLMLSSLPSLPLSFPSLLFPYSIPTPFPHILSPSLSLGSHHLLSPFSRLECMGERLTPQVGPPIKCLLLLFEPKILRAILMIKQTDASYRLQPLTIDPKPIF